MTNSKKSTKNDSEQQSSFAIAETSGKQVLFEIDRYYDLDRINLKEKEKITLENILFIKDKESISIGKPYIKNAKIELEIISHRRDKKIIVYKMRPKKKTRKKMGHRQELTRVMVKSISINSNSSPTSSAKATTKKASTAKTTTKKATTAKTTTKKTSSPTKNT